MCDGKTQYKQQVILFTRILLVIITFQILSQNAHALNDSPQTFTVDGQLFQTGGANLLLDPSVKITVQVIDPTAHCLLYEEQQTANTRDSGGYFHLNIGSAAGSAKRTVNDPGRTMAQVFQNMSGISANNVPGQTCAGGIYTPSPGAIRYFRITVTPSTTGVADVLSPDIVMDSVPTAVVAQSLQGLEKASILQVTNTGSTALTQGNLEALFTTPAYTNLQAILAGNFIKTDSSGAALPSYASDPAGAANGDIWFDSTTGQIKYQTSGGVQTIGAAGSGTISSLTVGSSMSLNGSVAGTISSGAGTIDLTNTGIAAGTYAKLTVDAKGRATAGTVSLVEADIPNLTVAGKVSGNTITSGTISGSADINTSGNLITTGTISGLNVQATNLRVYNGANYIQISAPALSGNVNLTLPVDDGNAGEVLSTDGNGILSWVSSMTTALTPGKIWVGNGSNVATAVTLSGDASLSNAGVLTLANSGVGSGTYTKVTVDTKGRVTSAANITSSDVTTALGYTPLNAGSANLAGDVSGALGSTSVDKIQGKAVTAASVSGQVMIYNGTSWVNSVVSGAGTLDYAGNLSLNTVPVSKGGTNATSFGANRVIASNGTGSALTDITCSLNQVLSFDASGYVVCANVSTLSGAILNGGNTTGADISIGTKDNKALALKVNDTTALTISQNGNIGIGTATPPLKFSVNGSSQMGNTGSAYGNAYLTINRNTQPDAKDNLFLDNVEYGAGKSSDIVFATGGSSRGFIIGGQDASGNGFLSLGGPSSNKSIYVNSSGNVGVGGLTSPSSALDISGALTAEGMSSAPSVSGSNTGRIYYDFSANKFKVSQNGGAYMDLVSGSSGYTNGGNAFGANATLGTTDNKSLGIITNNTTAMTISQNGYVGIGTASPAGILDVRGGTAASGSGTNINIVAQSGTAFTDNGGSIILTSGSAGSYTGSTLTVGGVTAWGTGTPGYITLFGGNGSNGVGSGGYVKVLNNSGNSNGSDVALIGGLAAGNGSGGNVMLDGGAKSGAGADGNVILALTRGSVGVGISTPSSALDVSGALTAEGMSSAPSVSASHTGRIYFDYASNKFKVSENGGAYANLVSATSGFTNGGNAFGVNATLGTTDNKPLAFITNNSTAMTISQGGAVGIGTATPSYGLHVKTNTFMFETTGGTPYMYAAGSGNLAIGTNSSPANKLDVGGAVAVGYVGTTAPSNGLIVAGNVGIGTTTPRTALDVSGTLALKPATLDASSTIDGSTGNIHYTSSSCGSFQFNNLKDGASYMFVVQGTSSATCTFTAFSDAGSNALTVHMPPDNGATTASKHTVFHLTVVGTHVYVAWTPGY